MLQQSKALVLNSLKYGESDLIVHCFTKDFGLKSYYLKGILQNKKNQLKKSFFQPLNPLEIIAFHNNRGQLNSLKEAQIIYHYQTLHIDIYKQSITLFLSEILSQTLKEETHDPNLFDFLLESFQTLDQSEKYANFHIVFLANYLHHIGFFPLIDENAQYFDFVEGKFVQNLSSGIFLDGEDLKLFKKILQTNEFEKLELNISQRTKVLDWMLQYMGLHLQNFKKPKSLVVLQELFH